MIDTTEPAEASISARIEELERHYQLFEKEREAALETAQMNMNAMLRTQGAIDELKRLRQEIWGTKGEHNGRE